MGVAWTPGGSGLSQHHPIIAYYSKSGQISGLGIMVFGDLPPYLVETGWWLRNDQETHMVQVGFRNPFDVCSSTEFEEMVGDRLVVNPSSTRFNIPLTHSDAIATGFVQGACIGGMGVHHSYDSASAAMCCCQSFRHLTHCVLGALSQVPPAHDVERLDVHAHHPDV